MFAFWELLCEILFSYDYFFFPSECVMLFIYFLHVITYKL